MNEALVARGYYDDKGLILNAILQHALAYASNGWRIFRLSKAKVPLRGTHGHLDASCDLNQVRAWFDRPRPPNIGLACGVGAAPIALDFDGPEALQTPWGASLMRAAAANGGLPETLMQQTQRGFHALYRPPEGVEIRTRNEPRGSKGGPGIDIKGLGGYIVLTPSTSYKGFTYSWLQIRPPTVMPDWMVDWYESLGGHRKERSPSIIQATLGPAPAYLLQTNQRDLALNASRIPDTEHSAHEEARIRAALASIPTTCGYDMFLRIGFALRSLAWERSDGTSIAYEIFEEWCSKSEHFNPAGLQAKWAELGRSSRGEVSLGTIFQYAKEAGWRGDVTALPEPPPQPISLSAAAAPALTGPDFSTPSRPAVVFRDTTENGFPKVTTLNTYDAITGLGVKCWHDVFHEKYYVAGELVNQWSGELSDDVVVMLRRIIRREYGFEPTAQACNDAAMQHCLDHKVDPLKDYLDGLKWDGTNRIGNWLVTYLGAADVALNRAIGRLVLIAAVRRARCPGTKFDQILVLEGIEGKGKSTAIEILASSENYSDQSILGRSDREQQELITGVWLYEISELQGMRRAEVDHVKAFASRKVDRARPAYGRYRVDKPRRCVFIATTNDDAYLKSETGNRRFWPVMTSRIDLPALIRDRDQLWAEAVEQEAKDASLVLDEGLWDAAREEQGKRQEEDPWLELIRSYVDQDKKRLDDVLLADVLVNNPFIQMRPDAMNAQVQMRAGYCMKRLRWVKYRKRLADGGMQWRYHRPRD